MASNVVPFARPVLALTAAIHPAFTAADIARMPASELAYFTDAPVAHIVAEQDFRRQRRIEREMIAAARRDSARRLAELAWA